MQKTTSRHNDPTSTAVNKKQATAELPCEICVVFCVDEKSVPDDMEVHLIIDNYSTHKTAAVARWLKAHPHWHLHFIPTHSSRLNQAERFFSLLTTQRIRRGTFQNLAQLKDAILEYIDGHNRSPRPFRWTATADSILGKVAAICNDLRGHHTR